MAQKHVQRGWRDGNTMKRAVETCERCGLTEETTVHIHAVSGVAVFTCRRCGRQQEP